jgi:hypothetical protein
MDSRYCYVDPIKALSPLAISSKGIMGSSDRPQEVLCAIVYSLGYADNIRTKSLPFLTG